MQTLVLTLCYLLVFFSIFFPLLPPVCHSFDADSLSSSSFPRGKKPSHHRVITVTLGPDRQPETGADRCSRRKEGRKEGRRKGGEKGLCVLYYSTVELRFHLTIYIALITTSELSSFLSTSAIAKKSLLFFIYFSYSTSAIAMVDLLGADHLC